MPRRSCIGWVWPCGMGAAAVAVACVGLVATATAQTAVPSTDPLTPRSALRNAPAFKPTGQAPLGPSTRGFTPIPSGAGRTGFDSTNARKKNAATRPAKKSVARPATSPAAEARASDAAIAAPAAAESAPSQYQKPIPPLAEQAMAARVPVTPVGVQPAPITKRKKLAAEGDPYEPLGLRLGTFDVFPAVEAYGGYDSNPGARSSGSGSALVTVAPELRAQSNWVRHELKADLRGSYTWYRDDLTPSVSRPQATGSVDGRIDVTRDTRIDLGGRLLVGTDYPNSPNVQAGLSRLPVFTTFGGVAGIAHRFNRLEVGVKGTVDRTVWQSSSLVDGTTADNNDRNLNQYGSTLRAGYELRPGVTPYVEAGSDTR
ncbi:MAG: outer membrane beta-barrel protein, partial [Pseudolabrys sp.]